MCLLSWEIRFGIELRGKWLAKVEGTVLSMTTDYTREDVVDIAHVAQTRSICAHTINRNGIYSFHCSISLFYHRNT